MSAAFSAKQPPYSVVISVDRKIRDFPIPVLWRQVCDPEEGLSPIASIELNMQRWLCMSRKEMSASSPPIAFFVITVSPGPKCSTFEPSPTVLYPGSEGHARRFSKAPIYTLCNSYI